MPFKLVSLTMLQNEADIVEYFVRSNIRLLDHMVIVLNPSGDGTGEILDALVAEGLPITVWRTARNFYAQKKMFSWFILRLRDQMEPQYLFIIDADEILLANSRDVLDRALEAIPKGQIGRAPWCSFLPDIGWTRAVFTPEAFSRRLAQESHSFFKITIPRDTALNHSEPVRNGAHYALRPDGSMITAVDLDGLEIAHLPVRSIPQIREKTIAGMLSKVIAEGINWRGRESFQRDLVWEMLCRTEAPDVSDIAAHYLDFDGSNTSAAETVPDHRLPDIPLSHRALVQDHSEKRLYFQLAQRLIQSTFSLPNPTDTLTLDTTAISDVSATPNSLATLPPGAFPAESHASNLKCDWPPIEHIVRRFRPSSVLDIGCGLGAYLRLLADTGAEVVGVDGAPWSSLHRIPNTAYVSHDLSKGPPEIEASFDAALCLEVVEHLPEDAGLAIVEQLAEVTTSAIIFSAAQPGQPGSDHITCRPAEFWLDVFARSGWSVNVPATASLRLLSTFHWFRRNFFVLCRGRQLDPEGLAHLLQKGRHTGVWPDHGHGAKLIGFPGQLQSFSLEMARPIPPLPVYAPQGSNHSETSESLVHLWPRVIRGVRRRGNRLIDIALMKE